jgi:selenocysteine lyase/cysteine desulfurase
VDTVARPDGDDWTAAVLGRLGEDVSVVAVPTCHWTDGTKLDLVAIGEACRRRGAALVVDGTQSFGAVPFSVDEAQPDFAVSTAHKWLLGPYSFGFCYISPKWQEGVPLEENWLNRAGSEDFSRLVDYRDEYQPGARRFDVGEASNFILAPIAAASLEQILSWGPESISEALKEKTDAIALRAEAMGFSAPAEAFRSPHLIGLRSPDGLPGATAVALASERVFVSVRGDAVRVSPHLYNNGEDIERLFNVLAR